MHMGDRSHSVSGQVQISSESPTNPFINSYGGPVTLFICVSSESPTNSLLIHMGDRSHSVTASAQRVRQSFYNFIWGTGLTLLLRQLRESDNPFINSYGGPVTLCICVSSESPTNPFINSYYGGRVPLCIWPSANQLRESNKFFYQFIWGTGPTLYLRQLRESDKSFYQFIWETGPTLYLHQLRESDISFYQFIWGTGSTLYLAKCKSQILGVRFYSILFCSIFFIFFSKIF